MAPSGKACCPLSSVLLCFDYVVLPPHKLVQSYLGLYYVLCDLTLLAQVIYYREKRRRSPDLSSSGETTALLGSEESSEEKCHAKKMLESESFIGTLALLFVAFVGVFGWFITAPSKGKVPREIWENKAQIVGWISAILYLTSRFPRESSPLGPKSAANRSTRQTEILKNTESKCEGLSLLFFFFALAGNVTFCAVSLPCSNTFLSNTDVRPSKSILIPSTDTNHMIINMSWLVGSAGTILLDFVVLFQFAYYAKSVFYPPHSSHGARR